MHVTAAQVAAAVAVGAGLALLTRVVGWALYVTFAWHMDRFDTELDALFDRPRDH